MTAPTEESRACREQAAYDEDDVWERCHAVQQRFSHVFRCPDSRGAEAFSEAWLDRAAGSGRILEIGCGNGTHASRLASRGSASVLAIDVSERFIAAARPLELPGRLEFRRADAAHPIEGRFRAIYGASVLHHMDYRPAVLRLYEENLEDGGVMVFREPLGANILIRAWWILGRAAHTPDERPFWRSDLRWFRETFPRTRFRGVNYLSFPAAIFTSCFLRSPKNRLLRATHRADRWIDRRLPWLRHRFRHVVIVVEKPAPRA